MPANAGRYQDSTFHFKEWRFAMRNRQNSSLGFIGKLEEQWERGRFLTISLDPRLDMMPPFCASVGKFLSEMVVATADLACCFQICPKFFYEPFGTNAHNRVRDIAMRVRELAPQAPLIIDDSVAGIADGIRGVARLWFGEVNSDAVTVCPFYGEDAYRPLLNWTGKGIIVNCRTSNKLAPEIQNLCLADGQSEPKLLYQHVAWLVSQVWNSAGNCALTIDAANPGELGKIRRWITQPDRKEIPIFVYGIGAQGTGDFRNDLFQAGFNAKDSRGKGFSVVVSRSVLYASRERDCFDAARARAQEMSELLANNIAPTHSVA